MLAGEGDPLGGDVGEPGILEQPGERISSAVTVLGRLGCLHVSVGVVEVGNHKAAFGSEYPDDLGQTLAFQVFG